MARPLTINDQDRRQWVENDEGLYLWWKGSRMGLYRFVRENRDTLTKIIRDQLERGPDGH
jgi:hypothetical protein